MEVREGKRRNKKRAKLHKNKETKMPRRGVYLAMAAAHLRVSRCLVWPGCRLIFSSEARIEPSSTGEAWDGEVGDFSGDRLWKREEVW